MVVLVLGPQKAVGTQPHHCATGRYTLVHPPSPEKGLWPEMGGVYNFALEIQNRAAVDWHCSASTTAPSSAKRRCPSSSLPGALVSHRGLVKSILLWLTLATIMDHHTMILIWIDGWEHGAIFRYLPNWHIFLNASGAEGASLEIAKHYVVQLARHCRGRRDRLHAQWC